jgi:hypothetical protein
MMVLAKASDHPARLRFRATDIFGPALLRRLRESLRRMARFLGAVVAVAGAILVEGDVENPVEAVLDGPVAADGAGEALGREAGGAEVVAGRAGGFAGLGAGRLDAGEGGEAGEPRLVRIATVGEEPIDVVVTRWRRVSTRPWSASVVSNASSGPGGEAKKASTSRSIAGRLALSANR